MYVYIRIYTHGDRDEHKGPQQDSACILHYCILCHGILLLLSYVNNSRVLSYIIIIISITAGAAFGEAANERPEDPERLVGPHEAHQPIR